MTYSRDRNFERDAVVSERDLLRDALTRSMGDVTFRDIKVEFWHRVEAMATSSRVDRLPDSPGPVRSQPPK